MFSPRAIAVVLCEPYVGEPSSLSCKATHLVAWPFFLHWETRTSGRIHFAALVQVASWPIGLWFRPVVVEHLYGKTCLRNPLTNRGKSTNLVLMVFECLLYGFAMERHSLWGFRGRTKDHTAWLVFSRFHFTRKHYNTCQHVPGGITCPQIIPFCRWSPQNSLSLSLSLLPLFHFNS